MHNDLRVIKTENLIQNAFVSVLEEKPFEKLSVTDILKKALINRKTFYSHYVDKFDLADKVTEKLYLEFSEFLEQQAENHMEMPDDFYLFLKENRKRISALWRIPVSKGSVYERIRETLLHEYIDLATAADIFGDLVFQGNLYASIRMEALQYIT